MPSLSLDTIKWGIPAPPDLLSHHVHHVHHGLSRRAFIGTMAGAAGDAASRRDTHRGWQKRIPSGGAAK
ncbi:MAG TPA: hypothetical protein VLR46_12205 [Candidatus Dormibacteraeota bacterium]|nr:hypothetical protein [Candidatus Dormibacteraeota bacterium]